MCKPYIMSIIDLFEHPRNLLNPFNGPQKSTFDYIPGQTWHSLHMDWMVKMVLAEIFQTNDCGNSL